MMSIAGVRKIVSLPDQVGRTHILVRQDGDDFVAAWDGTEIRSGNPFGLDSRLSDAGAPAPRSLWLVSAGDWRADIEDAL